MKNEELVLNPIGTEVRRVNIPGNPAEMVNNQTGLWTVDRGPWTSSDD